MSEKLVLASTGGTISMMDDPVAGGAVPALNAQQMLERIAPLQHEIITIDFEHSGGSQLRLDRMLNIIRDVEYALCQEQAAGAVITMGTDAIEEASFLCDLVAGTEKPIVITGSLRTASELSYDGARNLYAALLVAASPQTKGVGCLVVLDDIILAASDTVKMDSLRPSSFDAPGRGRVGTMVNDNVILFHQPLLRQQLSTESLENSVQLVDFGLGGDTSQLKLALSDKVPGVVAVAAGAGHLPAETVPIIEQLVDSGCCVVVASRCASGFVSDHYAYPGAGRDLRQAGAIMAQGLSPLKARVKLMVALGASRDRETLRRYFEWIY